MSCRQILCTFRHLQWVDRGSRRSVNAGASGGRGSPSSDASQDHYGGKGKHTDPVHLNSPVYLFSSTAPAAAEVTITSFRIDPMLRAVDLVSFVSRRTVDGLELNAIG
jgi:hypothetical protein